MREKTKNEKINLAMTGGLLALNVLLLLKEMGVLKTKIIGVLYGLVYGAFTAITLLSLIIIIILFAIWLKKGNSVKELIYGNKKKPVALNNKYDTRLIQLKNLTTIVAIFVNIEKNRMLTGVLWLPVILTIVGLIVGKLLDLLIYLSGNSKYHVAIKSMERNSYNSKILDEYFELVDALKMETNPEDKEAKKMLKELSKEYYIILTNNFVF